MRRHEPSSHEASTADESPQHPTPSRDYSALIILAVLAAVEIAILYALMALDTPLTPLVHRLLRNPAGVFTLVMCVVMIPHFRHDRLPLLGRMASQEAHGE
jgi:hypothetical protein